MLLGSDTGSAGAGEGAGVGCVCDGEGWTEPREPLLMQSAVQTQSMPKPGLNRGPHNLCDLISWSQEASRKAGSVCQRGLEFRGLENVRYQWEHI